MEHSLSKTVYMEVLLLLPQIVFKLIFPIQCMEHNLSKLDLYGSFIIAATDCVQVDIAATVLLLLLL